MRQRHRSCPISTTSRVVSRRDDRDDPQRRRRTSSSRCPSGTAAFPPAVCRGCSPATIRRPRRSDPPREVEGGGTGRKAEGETHGEGETKGEGETSGEGETQGEGLTQGEGEEETQREQMSVTVNATQSERIESGPPASEGVIGQMDIGLARTSSSSSGGGGGGGGGGSSSSSSSSRPLPPSPPLLGDQSLNAHY